MYNTIKAVFVTAIAILALGLATQAAACGGNQCNNTEWVEAGGAGQTQGWYDASGRAHNQADGNITERVTMSESFGETRQSTEFTADTCGGSGCSGLKAQVSGSTEAGQRNYSFISSDGGNAASSAAGDAKAGNAAASAAYRSSGS